MSGATLLGVILVVGGALLEWISVDYGDGEDGKGTEDVMLFRSFLTRRGFTRTSRLVQALGTVLFIIGVLALLL